MKKIFIKAFAVFAAVTLTLTGCSVECPASDSDREDSAARGGLSDALEKSADVENTAEESIEEKNDTETSENTDSETKAATEAAKTTEDTEETAQTVSEPTDENTKEQNINTTASANIQTVTSVSTETSAAVRTTAQTAVEPVVASQEPIKDVLTASFNIPATWQENGSYCGTCEFTITNSGGNGIENWTVKIKVPDGFKVTASWNGKFDLSGTTLTG